MSNCGECTGGAQKLRSILIIENGCPDPLGPRCDPGLERSCSTEPGESDIVESGIPAGEKDPAEEVGRCTAEII